jgi:hypothetical protein
MLRTGERVFVNAGSTGAGSSSTIQSLQSRFCGRKGLSSSDSWFAIGSGVGPSSGRGSGTRARGGSADFPTALFTWPTAEGPASSNA